MAKLLNWTTVLLILALIVAIAGVSFLSMSTQWLVIILIALALVSNNGATSTLAFWTISLINDLLVPRIFGDL